MHPPIIACNFGDILIFRSIDDAERYIDHAPSPPAPPPSWGRGDPEDGNGVRMHQISTAMFLVSPLPPCGGGAGGGGRQNHQMVPSVVQIKKHVLL
jgi:hypothetical protein